MDAVDLSPAIVYLIADLLPREAVDIVKAHEHPLCRIEDLDCFLDGEHCGGELYGLALVAL